VQRAIADELSVVPHVEEFRAELNIAPPLLIQRKVLEEREAPVIAAWTPNEAAGCVTPRARGWCRENGGIEPLVDGVRIMTCSAVVGTVQVRSVAGNQIGDIGGVQTDIERSA